MHRSWNDFDSLQHEGKVFIVTGATSGLGLEASKALVRTGATVVMTARNAQRGAMALAEVNAVGGPGSAVIGELDLTSLKSVDAFARHVRESYERVDVLLNNAGVMATPFVRTEDGFELQIGTNHLGHVALTSRLLPMILATPASRVVTVSSVGHRGGRIDLDDLNCERRTYRRWPAYFQSKLANLLFAFELDRRLRAAGSTTTSLAAHPGGTRSNLGIGSKGLTGAIQSATFIAIKPLLMSTAQGALPEVRAAIDSELSGGTYIGPSWPGELRGKPKVVKGKKLAYNEQLARDLWDLSNRLTNSEFVF